MRGNWGETPQKTANSKGGSLSNDIRTPKKLTAEGTEVKSISPTLEALWKGGIGATCWLEDLLINPTRNPPHWERRGKKGTHNSKVSNFYKLRTSSKRPQSPGVNPTVSSHVKPGGWGEGLT